MINADSIFSFRQIQEIVSSHWLLTLGFRHITMGYNESEFAPYHNTWHMLCVVKYTDYLIRMEKMAGRYVPDDDQDETVLLLAAMLHDLNHSAGEFKDDVNIEKAKAGIKVFIDMHKEKLNDNAWNPEWMYDKMCSLLDATQFPYVLDAEKLSMEQKILRDADMMQPYEPNMFYHLIMGLAEEQHKELFDTIMNNGIVFNTNHRFNTVSGINFHSIMLPHLISDMKKYAELVK